MDIPPEILGPVSLYYQAVKGATLELIRECHDPDYETTLENVRRRISEVEEKVFQLALFEVEGIRPRAGEAGA